MSFNGIREQLDSAKSEFGFIPEQVLMDLFSRQTIVECVRSLNPVPTIQAKDTAEDVLDKATKVFAILVHIKCEEEIRRYLDRAVYDGRLPLGPGSYEHLKGYGEFLAAQWLFLAPKLERGRYRVFENNVIMPFDVGEIGPSGNCGSYGKVDKVHILASHQNFFEHGRYSESRVVVARKTIPQYDPYSPRREEDFEEEFKREQNVLSIIAQKRHPAIVELLCSFRYQQHFHFLFPLAEMDLHDLLLRDNRPPLLQENEDLYRAIGGVGAGLEAIQQLELDQPGLKASFIGYHHDLKPRNILVQGKCFLISDFGHAHFHLVNGDLQARVRESTMDFGLGTEEYGPPQKDPEWRSHKKNPYALDYWSFGCILLELLIYAVKGRQNLESFRMKKNDEYPGRCQDSCFHIRGHLKECVSNEMNMFNDTEPLPTTAESALLDLARELLNPSEPLKRLDCQISKTISDILARHPSTPWDLEEAERNLQKQGSSAELHLKALINDEGGVNGLLNSQGLAALEAEDDDGRLPLHWAALAGSNSMVNLICSQDKRLARRMGRIRDKSGHTPLSISARSSQADVFRTLLAMEDGSSDAGHPLFSQDANAMGPLHHAAKAGCSDIIQQIIAQLGEGSDGLGRLLLCKDRRGRIPLHYAAEMPFCSAADAMLQSYPALQHRMLSDDDDVGNKPADCANRVGNRPLAARLHQQNLRAAEA